MSHETCVVQEISKARQHQARMLDRPSLSSNLPSTPAPTRPPNPAHMEVDSAPSGQGARQAAAGIKREASDIPLTDQQPVKVVRLHPQAQFGVGPGHGGVHPEGSILAPQKRAPGPGAWPQTAHTEGEKQSALAEQLVPAGRTDGQALELRAAGLSPEARAVPEAAPSMLLHGDATPIKTEWTAVPTDLRCDPATPVPPHATPAPPAATATPPPAAAPAPPPAAESAATAAGWAVPKSEDTTETIKPLIAQIAISLDDNPMPASPLGWGPMVPQGGSLPAEVKSEPQDNSSAVQELGHVAMWGSAGHAPAGMQAVKEDPDAVWLDQRGGVAPGAVYIKLEPVHEPCEEQGLRETALAAGLGGDAPGSGLSGAALRSGLGAAAPDSECTPGAEGRVGQPQVSVAHCAPLVSMAHDHTGAALSYLNAQTASHASSLSPLTPQKLTPELTAYTGPHSNSAALTQAPVTTVSASLSRSRVSSAVLPVPLKHEEVPNAAALEAEHTGTDSTQPICSPPSFSVAFVADLLAKRRQELLAQPATVSRSPADSKPSPEGGAQS